jgi:hypothetical protein
MVPVASFIAGWLATSRCPVIAARWIRNRFPAANIRYRASFSLSVIGLKFWGHVAIPQPAIQAMCAIFLLPVNDVHD